VSWFSRMFGHHESNASLDINYELIKEGNALEDQQKIQTALVRLQGREIRQQMISSALDIKSRREQ